MSKWETCMCVVPLSSTFPFFFSSHWFFQHGIIITIYPILSSFISWYNKLRSWANLYTDFFFAGWPKIQPLLRANADGGEFIWPHDGVRCGSSIHSTGAESNVSAFPVPEGGDSSTAEAQLWGAGGERWGRGIRLNEGRDAEAEDVGAEPEAAESVPADGDDGTGSLETTKRVAWTICQHFESLAFWAFSSPVCFFFSLSPSLFHLIN